MNKGKDELVIFYNKIWRKTPQMLLMMNKNIDTLYT